MMVNLLYDKAEEILCCGQKVFSKKLRSSSGCHESVFVAKI